MRKLLFTTLLFISCSSLIAQQTYKVGMTEYFKNKYYPTTGMPMVKPNKTNIKLYLISKGLVEIPVGYRIDYTVPFTYGGTDDPCNMQLLTKKEKKRRRAVIVDMLGTQSVEPNSQKITIVYPKSDTIDAIITVKRTNMVAVDGIVTPISMETVIQLDKLGSHSQDHNGFHTAAKNKFKIDSKGGRYYIDRIGVKRYIRLPSNVKRLKMKAYVDPIYGMYITDNLGNRYYVEGRNYRKTKT